jgi:hypothetical protein
MTSRHPHSPGMPSAPQPGEPMDFSISNVSVWREDLESETAGEFWIDRGILVQRTSHMSESQRTVYTGIVDKLNDDLDHPRTNGRRPDACWRS